MAVDGRTDKEKVESGHEWSDVNVRGVAWFGVGLFIAIVLVLALMWFMFRYFEKETRTAEPPPTSRIAGTEPRLPPEPRLQGVPGHETKPQVDMRQLRETENAVLTSFGWVDKQTGVVRIPIDHAKKLIVERGLPARTESGSGASPK